MRSLPLAVCLLSLAAFADPAEYAKTIDGLWATRDDAEAIKQTDAAISAGLKESPNDYDLLWRAARFRWFTADGVVESDRMKLKKQLGKEAWNYADRALKVKADGFEGHYYKALSIGAYSQSVGIMTALSEGLEGQFVENLDFAIKANEGYDRAGPLRAKGRYYWELPWPKRDLGKSKELLEKAIKLSPEHSRSWLFLAETLLKDGKAKEAKEALAKATGLSADFDPPEARRVQKWAKPVSDQIEKELK
jgi:tetratricopeptide (TPR) repeat protein